MMFIGEDSRYQQEQVQILQTKQMARLRITEDIILDLYWQDRRYFRWACIRLRWAWKRFRRER